MRIPSQFFNEDNLYRRRNHRVDSAQSYRRLMRLVIALALVIVVMRQASRPAIYEVFFGDPGTKAVPTAPGPVSVVRVGVDESVEIEPDAETRLIANQLTGALSPKDQLQWLATLSRWRTLRPAVADGIFAKDVIQSTVASTLSRLDTIDGVSQDGKNAWREMIQALLTYVSSQGEPIPSETGGRSERGRFEIGGEPQVVAWISSLDAAATNRVVDGSVWQSADFDAFYRFLDQAESLSDAGAVSTGVLPLLQQPEVYRNQRLRFAGTVARAEQADATDNPFGIKKYWRLWLRPRDGAERPLLAIVPDVPVLVASVGSQASELEGPTVTMVGRFLKRLPYRSSIGADLAPVLIGRLVTAPVTEAELPTVPTPTNTHPTSRQFWLSVAAASAIGIFLAAIAMWRTSAMQKRARELRVSHRKEPHEFLDELRSITSETEAANALKDNPSP